MHLSAIVESAQGVLDRTLGRPVHLGKIDVLTDEGRRATVLRIALDGGESGVPSTVIVKSTLSAHGEGEPDASARARQRFLSEAASIVYLDSLETLPPLCPQPLGADLDREVVVMQDLGHGTSLAELLTEDDAEAATAALSAYARTLGRIHAASAGQEARFAEICERYPGAQTRGWSWRDSRFTAELNVLSQACHALDVPIGRAFDADVERMRGQLGNPGSFLTFNIGDACPDNHFLVGDAVRFFDFEFSGFGHALMEAAYLRLPFPSCWCASRLPAGVVSRVETVYRGELSRGCPPAHDDRLYEELMVSACAYWTLATVSWTILNTLARDDSWGLLSHRQRHIHRLEALSRQVDTSGYLPGIGPTCARLAGALRARWPDIEPEMPLYPAFQ